MPKGKELSDFGREFEQMLLRVDKAFLSGADEFPIDFATHKLAHALRFRIYSYFNALRVCGDRPDLTAMCTNLSMRIAGTALVFYRKGEDKESEALRNALGLEKGFADGPSTYGVAAPDTVLSGNLDSLRALRANKFKK